MNNQSDQSDIDLLNVFALADQTGRPQIANR